MPFLCFVPRRIPVAFGWVAAWVWAWLPGPALGQDGPAIVAALEDRFTQIIESAEPSVVSIARIGRSPDFRGDRTGEGNPPLSSNFNPEDFVPSEFGAGIVFEPADQPGKRFILTMYHVVKGGRVAGAQPSAGDDLFIHTHKRQKAPVEIVAADPRSDLAVLRVQAGQGLDPADLKPIRMAESPVYKKGQFVLTLSNPYAIARDGSACAGWGMLSNIARIPKPPTPGLRGLEKVRQSTIHHQGTLLQIDGNLNLGTSGGAVLNRKGELIGIITAMAALEGYEKSVGYAVPLNAGIRRVITELAHGYEAEYGLLGIVPVTVPFLDGEQPTATKVDTVGLASPAGKAGIRQGDLIYAVDETPIYTDEDLMREIALIGPQNTAELHIYRPRTRERLTKEVTLTKWPVVNEDDIITTKHRHEWNGIVVDHATARFESFNDQYREAVLVTHIERRSPADYPDLRKGNFITHVDGQRVRTPEDFDAATKGKTPPLTLRLLDQNRSVIVEAN